MLWHLLMFLNPRHKTIAYTPQLDILAFGRNPKLHQWHYDQVLVPYWRIYWNDRAGAWLRAPDGRRYEIAPERFTLVAPNTLLSSRQQRMVCHYFTHFIAGLPYAHIHDRVHTLYAQPQLVHEMVRNYAVPAGRDAGVTQNLATALKLCWHALSTLPDAWLQSCATCARLDDALHWWEGQKWRQVSNAELAACAGMHPAAFCRHFRHAMGYTPHAYGLLKRVEEACVLLHFTNHSIKQIADQTGFCDRYYFSCVFRKLRGVSPAAYRSQCAQNHQDAARPEGKAADGDDRQAPPGGRITPG